jgi:hypothetical protein
MQVLNAPTRKEVDEAHFRSSWLDIGVPSFRNAFRVSRFKTWSWIVFLLSSIPIHLLSNSTIFEVDTRESDFHLTIATEDFLHGGAFYPPGSSLVPPGLGVSGRSNTVGYLYGNPVNISDYDDSSSLTVSHISAASTHATAWERLNVVDVSCFCDL